MAGDFKKPDLVHTLFPEEVPGKLWNLPVDHLLFAGKSTCKRLKSLGIYTIGDLAQADSGMLFAHMKKHGLARRSMPKGMKAPECLIWMRKIKDAETASRRRRM